MDATGAELPVEPESIVWAKAAAVKKVKATKAKISFFMIKALVVNSGDVIAVLL